MARASEGEQRKSGRISAESADSFQEMLSQIDLLLPKWQKNQEAVMVQWYPRLVELKGILKSVSETGSQNDVFKMIPFSVDYARAFPGISDAYSDDEHHGVNKQTKALRHILHDHSLDAVDVMADYLSDNNGVASRELLTSFLDYTLTPHVIAYASREEKLKLNDAGLFILNPDLFFDYIKRLPKTATENIAASFRMESFNDYETNGGGLLVLKTQYANNKNYIMQVRASMLAYLGNLEKAKSSK